MRIFALMNDKKFNKWFSAVLMTLMVVAIAITTVFKLQEPQARTFFILVAALGSAMGVASSVMSANGLIWTFVFGLMDIACCLVVDADNGIWGDFSMHLFYLLPMQILGIRQWRKRGASGAKTEVKARRLTGKQRCVLVGATLAGLAAVYGILFAVKLHTVSPSEINRTQVFSDAARTTFNIAGQVLMSLAFYEQWYLWILVNVASIFLWGSTMLSSAASSYTVVMFIKYCFYFVNSLNGLRIWYKLSKDSSLRSE
ncbi:MAG: nicotinamide mononucleotide transporter [Bacteroidales bacterium]|nr:nicotinamide mononucleotide transporter [Bacteroidales bacterium]